MYYDLRHEKMKFSFIPGDSTLRKKEIVFPRFERVERKKTVRAQRLLMCSCRRGDSAAGTRLCSRGWTKNIEKRHVDDKISSANASYLVRQIQIEIN